MHKYRLISIKGEGTFSEVLKAQSVKNGKCVAIKCMKNRFESLQQVNNLREIQALRRLSPHPHIVKLLEVLYDIPSGKPGENPSGRLALVFELMDCNIYELIKGRKHYLREDVIKRYMFQLLKALDHMHRNGIFHRDIKPENILIQDKVLRLADFGSCRGIYSKQPYTEYISTRWYRAPECLLTDGYYGYKMDVWGVGCVIFEVLALFPLFPGKNEADQIERIHKILGTPSADVIAKFQRFNSRQKLIFKHYAGTGITKYLAHVSPEAVDLIQRLLIYDPEERITAKQALKHPWFADVRAEEKRRRQEMKDSAAASKDPTDPAEPGDEDEDGEHHSGAAEGGGGGGGGGSAHLSSSTGAGASMGDGVSDATRPSGAAIAAIHVRRSDAGGESDSMSVTTAHETTSISSVAVSTMSMPVAPERSTDQLAAAGASAAHGRQPLSHRAYKTGAGPAVSGGGGGTMSSSPTAAAAVGGGGGGGVSSSSSSLSASKAAVARKSGKAASGEPGLAGGMASSSSPSPTSGSAAAVGGAGAPFGSTAAGQTTATQRYPALTMLAASGAGRVALYGHQVPAAPTKSAIGSVGIGVTSPSPSGGTTGFPAPSAAAAAPTASKGSSSAALMGLQPYATSVSRRVEPDPVGAGGLYSQQPANGMSPWMRRQYGGGAAEARAAARAALAGQPLAAVGPMPSSTTNSSPSPSVGTMGPTVLHSVGGSSSSGSTAAPAAASGGQQLSPYGTLGMMGSPTSGAGALAANASVLRSRRVRAPGSMQPQLSTSIPLAGSGGSTMPLSSYPQPLGVLGPAMGGGLGSSASIHPSGMATMPPSVSAAASSSPTATTTTSPSTTYLYGTHHGVPASTSLAYSVPHGGAGGGGGGGGAFRSGIVSMYAAPSHGADAQPASYARHSGPTAASPFMSPLRAMAPVQPYAHHAAAAAAPPGGNGATSAAAARARRVRRVRGEVTPQNRMQALGPYEYGSTMQRY